MKLELKIETEPKRVEVGQETRGALAQPLRVRGSGIDTAIKPMIVSASSVIIAAILCVPQLSQVYDGLPGVKQWQKMIATAVGGSSAKVNKKPTTTQQPIFPLKYEKRITGVPNDCRPIWQCRRLGLEKYADGYRGIRRHAGVDYAAPIGTKVLAIVDLKVSATNPDSSAGGIIEAISTDGKHFFRYIHLGRNSVRQVSVNQKFKQGETIALIGFENNGGWGTGPHLWGTGPHLHFEKYDKQNGKWVLDTEVQQWIP